MTPPSEAACRVDVHIWGRAGDVAVWYSPRDGKAGYPAVVDFRLLDGKGESIRIWAREVGLDCPFASWFDIDARRGAEFIVRSVDDATVFTIGKTHKASDGRLFAERVAIVRAGKESTGG